MARGLYVISIAAELVGVHPQTLRAYEREGLIDPVRTGGGSRRYSDDDVARLQRIQELTGAGLNLAGVRMVLELEEELARLRSELDAVLRRARAAVDDVHRQYRRDLVPLSQSVVPFQRPAGDRPPRRSR